MSTINRSVHSLLHTRFLLLLVLALVMALGVVQMFVPFSHAHTTAAFTPGNIVVYRVGDGTGVLSAAAAPVFLDEFTPAGALVQSVPMPTAVVASNRRLTAAGNSTSEGFLTRSVDGNYLVVPGYDAAVATGAVAGTTSATVNRVIGRVDAAGTVDTTTALTDAISAGNPRGATSTNGTDLWLSGTSAGGGIRYATFGATTSTALNVTVTNLRATNIFGGQLYLTSASGTTRLVAVGSGTPTTAGQALNSIPGLDSTTLTGPYAFFFADLNAGVAGNDTLYVADEAANLIKKFSLVGGTWTANGSIAAAAARALTASVSGTTVSLFVQNNGTTLSTLTDASGYNATITGTLTSIATAGTNTAFRGVALVPAAVAPTISLSINDVTQAETNAGTTTFSFTVSLALPAGPGGVTFDIATADGVTNPANAGSDYVAKSLLAQTIPQGSSTYQFDVVVNGDTTPEPNETFFVNVTNVTGATVTDGQGLGTITNDDVSLTPIHTIQGTGNSSPFVATSVTTSGIVTGLRSNGFFLQEPDASVDADPNTSEGIFVFTSAAPPAAAVTGNNVQVTGTVAEFVPASDPGTQSQTELTSPTVSVNSTGNGLPAPHTITGAETLVNNINNLEKYEGMRVHVDSLTVGAPTGGSVDEVNATSTSFGDFYGVITGVPRPFREPGIELPYAVPTPYPSGAAPASVPIFDANPERIRVNGLGLTGSVDLQVSSNAVVTGITGPLDFGFRTYTIDTDPPAITPTPLVAGGITLAPVPVPNARELTIGSFNMQRFFDTTDDPSTSDVVLTVTAFNNRLNKASLAIRNVMRSPDVIGIEEMEGGPAGTPTSEASILQQVANKVNTDAGTPGDYQAYLARGNDVGGINVAFLVRSSRITVFSSTQYNKTETFIDPSTGASATLNDRPPLVLRASIVQPSGATLSFSVVVNHLRSLGSVTLQTNAGAHTRVKKQKEAESLATLINEMQNGGARQVLPYDQNIVSVGDYNAFQFNDGYTDVMGTVRGVPTPASQVVESSPDLNNPDLTDLIGTLTAAQQYSYTFGGNAQALDHTVVNQNMLNRFSRFAYARMDSDFSDNLRSDPNRPERISDHDPEVAYFNMAIVPTAANGVVSGRITDPNGMPVAGAVVNLSGTQNRKFITDANGNYRFENVETGGFYTVRPSRTNYSFSPAERSFSQIGNNTEATFTGALGGGFDNPLNTPEYFVRQHYLDFLGREPDESGFNFWSDQMLECGADAACSERRAINVSAAYFLSIEFQQTGGFVDSLHRISYGARPTFAEFMPEARALGQGVIVGNADWAQHLAANKQAFIDGWVARPEFRAAYDGLSNSQYVDALISHTGVDFSPGEREGLVNSLANGTQTRSGVLQSIAEDERFANGKRNEMFVMMQYFGYLRRDPDASGYAFWLNKLNQFGGNFEQAEMVKAFIVSGEYRARFAQ